MKLSCVLLLSVITLVSCTVPSVFLKPGKNGKNCICREKECTDVSCEEKNCLCSVVRVEESIAFLSNCDNFHLNLCLFVLFYFVISTERAQSTSK